MSGLVRQRTSQSRNVAQVRMCDLKGFDMEEITIAELQQHYAKSHFTAVQYTSYCLERIRRLNPYLQAVIETNPEALEIAQALDNERALTKIRGPLHGIPVMVKDNFATKDLMQTTAGSWALLGSVVPRDAFVVQKLRQAGAILLGHTNMSEWSSVRSKTYSTGYSPRGGQTRNPFNLQKTPFGSSSGSAVVVSANIVPVTFGTETDTSIIGPATTNGVVGIKPTVGLTSRMGIIPVSENLDTVGSFGRTVEDAVTGLDAIVGPDAQDPFTCVAQPPRTVSYVECLSTRQVLKGARFGLPMKRCWDTCPADCKAVATKVLDVIREAGAEIVEVDLPSIDERVAPNGKWNWEHGSSAESEWTVVKTDAYNGINTYLMQLEDTSIHSVEDLVDYNQKNNGSEGATPGTLPAFPNGQDNLIEIQNSKGERTPEYVSALEHIHKQTREHGIDAALMSTNFGDFQSHQLDALIFCDRRGIGQQYAAQAGYPIICIPIGIDSNEMPISLSFQHSAWREADLVKWASAVEDAWKFKNGRRAVPSYKNLTSKNIPIEPLTS